MTSTDEAGNVLLEELKWVHNVLRGELQACRDLAAQVKAGVPPEEVRARVELLQTRGPLWLVRTNCLRYCQFVHGHHGHEDVLLFPAVRRYAPDLSEVVDKLEADHRQVSDLLDTVEGSARRLGTANELGARDQLVEALEQLSEHLLEHLAYEEAAFAPVLAAWDYWPFFGR
jgi:iron-sulfur cluster repair protein YtfE (RIC family)